MSKEKYKNTHKDFKGGTKKEPRVSVYDPEKKATVSRLVKFSEMRGPQFADLSHMQTPEQKKAAEERLKKFTANTYREQMKKKKKVEESRDAALDAVKKSIIAQYGKGAIMRKGSNQQKKVRGAKSTAGTGKYKKMADDKKQLKKDAKEMGYGSDTKSYIETRARYGSKENMKSGRGLGT